MKTKHTPGPWKQYGLAVRAGARNVCSNVNAARSGLNITEQVDAALANARLIAAAPELLEALQGLLRAYEALPGAVTHNGSLHSHAVYAISKATGEDS